MSRSAFSAKVFAIYLFFVGVVLVFAPNLLLSVFRFHRPRKYGFMWLASWRS